MCGIVGLFIKDPSLEPELGKLTAQMLATMSDRGPDSAGFAVYGAGKSGETKLTLRASSAEAAKETAARIAKNFSDAKTTTHDTHVVVALADASVAALVDWLASARRPISSWSGAAGGSRSTRRSAARKR